MERFRRRSPDRGRYPREGPPGDSYIPNGNRGGRLRSRSPIGGYHRRSRSPPPRADTWAPRSRSPPHRYDTRDGFSASRRDYGSAVDYDRRRSSPPSNAKRTRDTSPNGLVARTSPPAKRERLSSPDRRYNRPRSPPRRGFSPPRDNRSYRGRSRSPPTHHGEEPYNARSMTRRRRSRSPNSGRNSGAQSRRSSPPGHGRRPVDRNDGDDHPDHQSRTGPPYRSSPPPRTRTPIRQEYEGRGREYAQNSPPGDMYRATTSASEYRDRNPPVGPSASRYAASAASPGLATGSMSAHNRPGSSSVPPSGPSSYPSRGDYGSGYRGRGGPAPGRDFSPRGRGRWGSGAPSGGYGPGRGRGDAYPPRDPYGPPRDDYHSRGPPTPRFGRGDSYGRGSQFGRGRGGGGPAFTGGNSTSRTIPQTVRFDVKAALADLPKVKEEGERLPPLSDHSKSDKLEEEAARLRKEIDEKDGKLRRQLRELTAAEREVEEAQLRTELAEERLKELCADEAETSGAF